LIQYRSVTDRQTDIPPLAIPAVCIARYANALVKSCLSRPIHLSTRIGKAAEAGRITR